MFCVFLRQFEWLVAMRVCSPHLCRGPDVIMSSDSIKVPSVIVWRFVYCAMTISSVIPENIYLKNNVKRRASLTNNDLIYSLY